MSTEQRATVDGILRQAAFPVDSTVDEQRRQLRQAIEAQPLPPDVTVTGDVDSGASDCMTNCSLRCCSTAAPICRPACP